MHTFSTSDFENIVPLNNGALMFTQTFKNVASDKTETFPFDTYALLDENLEIKHLGNISRDTKKVGDDPTTIITPVSDNKAIYTLQGTASSTIWLINTDDYSVEKIEATEKGYTIFSTHVQGSDLYLFSRSDKNPTRYRIDKAMF